MTRKGSNKHIVAAVQASPIFLDLDATIDKGVRLIGEAAASGAKIVGFPETWVSGYPIWIYGAAGWLDAKAGRAYARLHASALQIGSPALQRLQEAARKHSVCVVMGANEKLSETSGTIYNSQFFIGHDGALLGVRRKVMPTYTERNVWGYGDGSSFRCFETPFGRVGGLICWEHWMPMTRMAMHARNEHIHIAAWPQIADMDQITSRHYAFEGRCFVICVGHYVTIDDIPKDFELFSAIEALGDLGGAQNEIFPGGSGIIGPDGQWLAGPITGREAIICTEVDIDAITEEKLTLDVTGHYNRPDLFRFSVNDEPRQSVDFTSDALNSRSTESLGARGVILTKHRDAGDDS